MLGRAAMLSAAAALAGCVPDGQWFTPAGVALGTVDCISPAPLEGASGREICKARLIGGAAAEAAGCRRQGGTVGPVSVVDDRLACTYPKSAPVVDDGPDGDGRTKNRAEPKA